MGARIPHTATLSLPDTVARVPATQVDMGSHPGSVTKRPTQDQYLVSGEPNTTFQDFHATSETRFPY